MRPFLMTVGILAWLMAFAVMWIFAESGGALTVIAAGVFATVAMVGLACERILKVLEEIRDRMPAHVGAVPLAAKGNAAVPAVVVRPVSGPATTVL
jgi:hypothetical protein